MLIEFMWETNIKVLLSLVILLSIFSSSSSSNAFVASSKINKFGFLASAADKIIFCF